MMKRAYLRVAVASLLMFLICLCSLVLSAQEMPIPVPVDATGRVMVNVLLDRPTMIGLAVFLGALALPQIAMVWCLWTIGDRLRHVEFRPGRDVDSEVWGRLLSSLRVQHSGGCVPFPDEKAFLRCARGGRDRRFHRTI